MSENHKEATKLFLGFTYFRSKKVSMEHLSVLASITLIWGAAALIPGPDFIIIVQSTASKSRFHGVAAVFGIATGTVIWGFAGFFGISTLFAFAPWLYVVLKILGGAYLIYLGVCLIKQSSILQPTMTQTHFGTSENLTKTWLRGLMTNLSNPKTALFVASIFATTLPAESNMTLGLLVIALITSISLIWYLLLVYFFALPIVNAAYKRGAKLIDRIAGGFFILFGAKLALDR